MSELAPPSSRKAARTRLLLQHFQHGFTLAAKLESLMDYDLVVNLMQFSKRLTTDLTLQARVPNRFSHLLHRFQLDRDVTPSLHFKQCQLALGRLRFGFPLFFWFLFTTQNSQQSCLQITQERPTLARKSCDSKLAWLWHSATMTFSVTVTPEEAKPPKYLSNDSGGGNMYRIES